MAGRAAHPHRGPSSSRRSPRRSGRARRRGSPTASAWGSSRARPAWSTRSWRASADARGGSARSSRASRCCSWRRSWPPSSRPRTGARARRCSSSRSSPRRRRSWSCTTRRSCWASSTSRTRSTTSPGDTLERSPERLRNWEWGHLLALTCLELPGRAVDEPVFIGGQGDVAGPRSFDLVSWRWVERDGRLAPARVPIRSRFGDTAVGPDGRRLVRKAEHGVEIVDVASDAVLAQLDGHERRVINACLSHDGARGRDHLGGSHGPDLGRRHRAGAARAARPPRRRLGCGVQPGRLPPS